MSFFKIDWKLKENWNTCWKEEQESWKRWERRVLRRRQKRNRRMWSKEGSRDGLGCSSKRFCNLYEVIQRQARILPSVEVKALNLVLYNMFSVTKECATEKKSTISPNLKPLGIIQKFRRNWGGFDLLRKYACVLFFHEKERNDYRLTLSKALKL